jgi:heme/copper-type cytochrome/quinol oxidase subunit 1
MNKGLATDFHFHDTYFVIAHTHIFWLFAMILLVIWTLYLLVNKILYSKGLTWTHIFITILTSVLLLVIFFSGDDTANLAPGRYYDFSTWNSSAMIDNHTKTIAITLSILLCGQIIFLINLIAGLFRHRNHAMKQL